MLRSWSEPRRSTPPAQGTAQSDDLHLHRRLNVFIQLRPFTSATGHPMHSPRSSQVPPRPVRPVSTHKPDAHASHSPFTLQPYHRRHQHQTRKIPRRFPPPHPAADSPPPLSSDRRNRGRILQHGVAQEEITKTRSTLRPRTHRRAQDAAPSDAANVCSIRAQPNRRVLRDDARDKLEFVVEPLLRPIQPRTRQPMRVAKRVGKRGLAA